MAIARNKRPTKVDQAAIAAFGAAAEAQAGTRQSVAPTASPAVSRATTRQAKSSGDSLPQASLVRWAEEEDLRDRLIAYRLAERYTMQDLMVKALRLGMDQLDGTSSR